MESIGDRDTRIIEEMQQMSDADQNKLVRFSIRLLNNDGKAIRYARMLEREEISAREFLDAM